MKKLHKWAVVTALFAALVLSAIGCAQTPMPSTVTLDLNYEGSTPIVESVAAGQSFYEPAAPTREGYEFAGWYKDAACTEGQEAVFPILPEGDLTLYAAWKVFYRYDFDANYEGGAIQSITSYEPIDADFRPAYRDGWNFGGWYKDAACTDGQEADLSVAGTYYAKWVENAHDAFAYVFASDNTGFVIDETEGELTADLVLPESHLGLPVVEIAAGGATSPTIAAAAYERVVIPGTIRTIGNYAFIGSTFGAIEFGEGVESIGNYAFARANATSRLSRDENNNYAVSDPVAPVTFPSSLRSIGTHAFLWTPLSAVTFNEGLESIGNYAFAGYTATNANVAGVTEAIFQPFTEVHFPSTLKTIGAQAFWLNKLEKVTFADGCLLDSMGQYAFGGNSWTTGQKKDFQIPIKYAELPGFSDPDDEDNATLKYIFQNCTSLEEVVFKGPVHRIGTASFKNCTALGTVEGKPFVLPEGVTYLYNAFENTRFTSITIPNTLEDSSNALNTAFEYNTALETVVFEEGMIVSTLNGTFQGCTALKNVTLPDSVTSLAANVFNGCTSLESITLPAGFTSISGNAFKGCTALTEVVLTNPDAVVSITSTTFTGCDQLITVTVPDALLGQYARDEIWGDAIQFELTWTNENLGRTVTFNYGGKGTDNTALYVTGETVALPQPDLWLDNETSTEYVLTGWYTDENFETPFDASVPVGDADITLYARWEACTDPLDQYYEFKLTEDQTAYIIVTGKGSLSGAVTLPESYRGLPVIGIRDGEGANVTAQIKDGAFAAASGITSLVIPSSYRFIGVGAFAGCAQIESIVFNEGLETIGAYAFVGRTSSTMLNAEAAKIAIKSLSFPQSLLSIGQNAFAGCDSLESITFHPNAKLESIGQNAFAGSYVNIDGVYTQYGPDITSLTIPASVKTIGNSAFFNADKLETLTFAEGSVLESIGNSAFEVEMNYQGTYGNYEYVNYAQDKLSGLVFPSTLISIGNSAFAGRTGLTNVVLNEGLTTVSAYAFAMYTGTTGQTYANFDEIAAEWTMASPTELNIPSSVTTLGNYAFAFWTDLQTVTFNGNVFINEEGDASFGDYMFAKSALTSAEGLKDCTILEMDYAFAGTPIRSVALPAGVELSSNTFADAFELMFIDLSAGRFEWASRLADDLPADSVFIVAAADLDFYLADDDWFALAEAGRILVSPGEVEQPEVTGVRLTFDNNYEGGGSSYAILGEGEATWVPSAPEREGYVFIGWYVDAECTELFVFGGTLEADTTVYAGWAEA